MKNAEQDDTPVDPPAFRTTTPTSRHTAPTVQLDFIAEDRTTAPVDVQPNTHEELKAGNYEIIKKIGEGAMAEIYLARHVQLSDDHHEELVALKVFSPRSPWAEHALERIRMEVRACRNIVNRYVVRRPAEGRKDAPLRGQAGARGQRR